MGGVYHGDHADHREGGIPLWAVKFFAALLMAAVCTAGCLLPVFIAAQAQTSRLQQQQQQRKRSKYRLLQALLSLINCFAAGAFLGLAIIHLLPEAVLQLERDGYLLVIGARRGGPAATTHAYNIAYVLAAVGFTAMLALEQFLAGGHAHCHRDSSAPLAAQAGDEAAVPVFPSFVDLSRCRASEHSPRLLQHPSHHHAQHHLLCTGASYCPGCDDCAEAATAAPAAGGEAATGIADAGNAELRGRQRMTGYADSKYQAGLGPAGERLPREGAVVGQSVAEKMKRPVLQLTCPEGSTIQEENFELFKQDEDRTNSRETANTSSGSSDSIQEKNEAPLLHPKKCFASYADGGQQKQVKKGASAATGMWTGEQHIADVCEGCSTKKVELQNTAESMSCSAREEQAETGITRPDNNEVWETDSPTAGGKTRLCVAFGPGVTKLPAMGSAVAGEEKETELPTWNDKLPHLLLGMTVNHEVTSNATNSDRGARENERANETKAERMSSGYHDKKERLSGTDKAHGNSSTKERCCTSNVHLTPNQDACLPTFRGKEWQRDRKTESTKATPGATGGGRSVAAHGRCSCNNFQTTDTVTPCCCCSGCCKKCGDHSHDPESSSRVHSGSMGANVQGGDSAVKQQRRALNGSGRPAGGTGSTDVEQVKKVEDTVTDEGEETGLQEVSVSSPQVGAHSSDHLSPRSKSIQCCGCCDKPGATYTQGRELLKKRGGDRQLEQQHWLGLAERHGAKTEVSIAVAAEEGEPPHTRRTRTCGRLLRWSGRFDAAKWSLAVALGVHAIFEGVILGTTMKSQDVWIAVLAILGHKGAEGVALSSTLLRLHMTRLHFILTLGLFVLASPFGVFLGAVATIGGTGVCGIFNALAVGAVLYTTNEMLSEFAGRCSRVRRALKLLAFTLGLGVLFGLDLLHAPFCTQHHAHNHNHHHHHH